MIIGMLGIVFLGLLLNVLVYEYRVKKTDDRLKTFDFTGYRGRL